MDEHEQYKVLYPLKYYKDFLNHHIRPDGRELLEFRPMSININSINSADGSATVKIGNTTVVCGIKAELAQPKAAQPDFGFIIPNIEMTPLCSYKFRPGPPSEEAQVLSRCLADIITNSKLIDLTQLCIAKDKVVWVLYCDIVCLDHDGCVLDACVTSLVAALKTLKLPKVNYESETGIYRVEESDKNNININITPVCTTFTLFDDKVVIADPTAEEENWSTSIITIAVANSEICFVHKPGGAQMDSTYFSSCLTNAKKKENSVNILLETVLAEK